VRRADVRAGGVEDEVLEGVRAYAREQEVRETATCETLTAKWAGVREKGRAYLARETAPGVEVVVPLDDEEDSGEDGGDNEDEEGPPDYEDEDNDEVLE
jgi:hypothetical protein